MPSAMASAGAGGPRVSKSRVAATRWIAGAGVLGAVFGHGLPSVAVLGAIAGPPPLSRVGQIRLSGRRDTSSVALTFDDGPAPATTPRILTLLDKLGLRATFFVTGTEVAAHPGLVEEIRAGGHAVETHGMAHEHHLLRGPRWVLADTARALDGLGSLGIAPSFLRPPYGQASAGTLLAARRHRLVPVLWSAWGREFAQRSPEAVSARVTGRLRPGSIVLLHDSDRLCGSGSVEAVEGALPIIAEELERRGLQSVTVGELLG